MPPTPDDEPAGRRRRHRHRCPRSSSTPTRTPRRRRRTTSRTLVRGHTFSPRPTTLWPYAEADPLPDAALLAGWLGRTIITLVTTYTRPGDRVLLLSPPARPRQPSVTPRRAHEPDPYAGLTEAAWTIIRLGRGVDTATAAPVPDYPDSPTNPPNRHGAESESGPRPIPHPRTDLHESTQVATRTHHEPDGQFDLIITAVHPHDTDWLTHTDWTALLTTAGTIGTITHSDHRHGRLLDPLATVVNTFRTQGLRWLDHIAVLAQPLPEPAHATHTSSPIRAAARARAAALNTEPLLIRAVHHDLLLIAPEASGTSVRDRKTSDE